MPTPETENSMPVTPSIGDPSPRNGNGSHTLAPSAVATPSAFTNALPTDIAGDSVAPDSTELTVQRTRQWWREALDLLAERARVQQEVEVVLDGQIAKAEQQHQAKVQTLEAQHIAQQNANQKQYLALIEQTQREEQQRWVNFEKEFRALEVELAAKHKAETAQLARKRQHDQWEVRTRYDGSAPEPQIRYQQNVHQLAVTLEQQAEAFQRTATRLNNSQLANVAAELLQLVAEQPIFPHDRPSEVKETKAAEPIRFHEEGPPRKLNFAPLPDLPEPNTPPERPVHDLQRDLRESLEQTGELYRAWNARWGIKLLGESFPALLTLTPAVLIAGLTYWLAGWEQWLPPLIAFVATLTIMVIANYVWRYLQQKKLRAELENWQTLRERAFAAVHELGLWAHHQMRREQLDLRGKFNNNWQAIGQRFLTDNSNLQERQRNETLYHQERRAKKLQEITDHFQKERVSLENKFAPSFAALQKALDRGLAAAEAERSKFVTATRDKRNRIWNDFVAHWNKVHDKLRAERQTWLTDFAQRFPEWNSDLWQGWQGPRMSPHSLPLGTVTLDVTKPFQALTPSPQLPWDLPTQWQQPALMEFPKRGSLLIEAAGAGRDVGTQLLQTLVLRLLMALPPAKARFTIIDPVGLGKNFAGMMHLADYDEALVTNRIWTEVQHIEQRLLDLSEQIEIIIQKYLRNEYPTIDAYNEIAGEVAEPFRFLVVANFPRNFTEAGARRLLSIAASGPRCGVYVLMLADIEQKMPGGFSLADMAKYADRLVWKNDRFEWNDDTFGKFPFTPHEPPSDEVVTKLVHQSGEAAKDARRVEVPFTMLAPPPEKVWQGSTQAGFEVALGRAGARKLQTMRLGSGTSQHVLIAGKTGSGKSTLLHTLIVNAALTYAPSELELYLIDFKKGVEFKDYAIYQLPQARVIAIESEREFGLSVLQRLDNEMAARGEVFRSRGKQDLNGYRADGPEFQLPRILLMIDEFQEFFTEEDRVSQQAALLLDRLVRQGRAFGIHLVLGTQTLGGAYTLARSTISQMGVRIALQCSESDAELILSDSNSAARLLSRPGEAIYNDANGRLEGNNPFQVAWLTEAMREGYLKKIHELAEAWQSTHQAPPAVAADQLAVNDWQTRRQVVFEGNAAADLRENKMLVKHWAAKPATAPQTALIWLGDPVSIKDPSAAVLARQPASNLLILGQAIDSSQNILGAALVALAAQNFLAPNPNPGDPTGGGVWILETSVADALGAPESTPKLAELAGELKLPHVAIARHAIPDQFTALAAEVERRTLDPEHAAPPIVLMIHNLARFRDLRRDENDFGYSFGTEAKAVSPDKNWQKILREGPAVGVHTLVWCDTLANLLRCMERATLREFDLRALFQMNAGDSSQLVDSPAASKLGRHFALFAHEESGVLEKFRPYAWPDAEWIKKHSPPDA